MLSITTQEHQRWLNLLAATETLLERREDEMVTAEEWDALREAVRLVHGEEVQDHVHPA